MHAGRARHAGAPCYMYAYHGFVAWTCGGSGRHARRTRSVQVWTPSVIAVIRAIHATGEPNLWGTPAPFDAPPLAAMAGRATAQPVRHAADRVGEDVLYGVGRDACRRELGA